MASVTSVSFQETISLMMFGFGDNQNPDVESVKLVESVVLKQLRDILYEAGKQAEHRNSKTMQPEDLIFLLRRDRHKMQRFVKYLNYKYNELPNISKTGTEVEAPPRKRYKRMMDFIESIDETGELLNIEELDTVKHDRAIRAERISSALDEEKYREYAKARQVSFFSKQFSQPNKFRDWVDPQQELNLSPSIIEILEIFAYGIVGHIVDMALIVRQNSKQRPGDPLPSLTGNYYNPAMFNVPHLPRAQVFPQRQDQVSLGQPPITVQELREVLRRCYMPQVGFIKFSNKSMFKKRKAFLY